MYIFVAVFVPANHIDAIHRLLFVFRLIIINLDDVSCTREKRKDKNLDEMHVESWIFSLLDPSSKDANILNVISRIVH